MTSTEREMLDAVHQRYSAVNPGNGPRFVVAEHVRSYTGFAGYKNGGRRLRTADALVLDLWPSTGHTIHGIEVKCSRSDWLTELKDLSKADVWRPYVDYWWIAASDPFVTLDELPPDWGLLVLGRAGLRVRKQAPLVMKSPMPLEMTASWMRSVARTAARRADAAAGLRR